MNREERVDVQDVEEKLPAFLRDSRAVRPGHCSRCDAPTTHHARFCPECLSYLPAPDIGRLASAKRRLGAEVLDSMFQDGGLIGSLLGPLIVRSGAGMAVVSVVSTVYWVYTLFRWSHGTTPAKHLLRMSVITEDGEPAGFWRMAFRETIGKTISAVVFGLGLLAIPYDKERQGWHDKMFGTWVVVEDEP